MTGPVDDGPAARVDALVTAIAPRVPTPALQRRDVVLVTGPWLAGVSGVAAMLRDRIPDRVFAEDLAAGEAATAVVFVVSAAAALTDSDCGLLDAAAANTDVVIGVVSKIDVHRHWPQMLETARATLAAHASRYRDVPWAGVAAAPDQGEPRVDNLVAEVRKRLADPAVQQRNRLRSWEFQLRTDTGRYQLDAEGAGRRARVALLQEQRDTVLRERRLSKSEQTMALRSRIAQARVQLSYFARKRCSSVRGELAEDTASMTRRRLPGFEAYLRSRIGEVIVEVDRGTSEHLADVAHELGLRWEGPQAAATPEVEPVGPALKSRQLETQLMVLLGIGFGLGVALTLSRLFAGLAPQLTAAGAAVGAVIGLAVTVWVVSTRGLLHDRAVLDRWVSEVAAALRSTAEELVALRVLSAESVLSAELAERNESEGVQVADQVAALDGELREHAAATARAAALRDREMLVLRRALAAVRAELDVRG
ncbi:MAG TPA: hypothetical protein VFQ37_02090 [Mycobacterium sp.]|nr:hypothetical protein [Mycobacterium sp.]